jgi:hypothetical protein
MGARRAHRGRPTAAALRAWLLAAAAALGCAACGGGGGGASTAAITANSGGGGSSGGSSSGGGLITVDTATPIATISANQFGTNLAVWYDVSNAGTAAAIAATGAHLLRWPGGSYADQYHWQTHTGCGGIYVSPGSTFDDFISGVVVPNAAEVAVTVDYGSNGTCTGGGSPVEAAAWVAAVVAKGYNVHHYTVGNEVYGSWEYDLHAVPHDPASYAAAVGSATSGGYYQLMKAQDPTAQIGVVVANQASWDGIVLGRASYDFVELHEYLQAPGAESDDYLLNQAPAAITADIASLRGELAAAGRPADTPIFLGEVNSVYASPGKQSISIVNGLFTGLAFGELLDAGVPMNAWFMAVGGGCNGGADSSSAAAALYGWQNFGSYDQVSEGWAAGACAAGSPAVGAGTVLPSGYAEQLAASFATAHESMLRAHVDSSLPKVRAYAATQGSGFALLLFNLDESAGVEATVSLAGAANTVYAGVSTTYGKAQYDDSRSGSPSGPVAQNLGSVSVPLTLTLPAWSMTVLKLQAGP